MKNSYKIVETGDTKSPLRSRSVGSLQRLWRKLKGSGSQVSLGRRLVFLGLPIVAALLVISVFATQILIDRRQQPDVQFERPEADLLAEQQFNRGVEEALAPAETEAQETPAPTVAETKPQATQAETVPEEDGDSPDDPELWLPEALFYVNTPSRLRLGASTDRGVISLLATNAQVTVHGQTADWRRVTTDNGLIGFVHSDLLSASPVVEETSPVVQEVDVAPEEVYTASADWSYGDIVYVLPETVRIRSGASTDYDQIGFALRGSEVMVLSDLGEWIWGETESGLQGYLLKELLSPYFVEREVSEIFLNQPMYVSVSYVYIRPIPSTASDPIAGAERNELVTQISTDGSWSKIRRTDGVEGYIRNDCLTAVEPDYVVEQPDAEPETDSYGFYASSGTVYVATAAARVRLYASTDSSVSDVLETVYYGDSLSRISTNGYWSKVETAAGTVGYIMNDLFQAWQPEIDYSDTNPEPDYEVDTDNDYDYEEPDYDYDYVDPDDDGDYEGWESPYENRDRYVWVFASAANIRSEGSMYGEVLTSVTYGTRLYQMASNGTWSKVETPGGTVGYIMNTLFQLEEISTPDYESNPEPITGNALYRQTVVDVALAQLGTPYVWGGASPGGGFDCSGLVLYAYRQSGFNMTLHGATSQANNYGSVVYYSPGDYSSLLPGDLLFFQDYSGYVYSHVAIYIGGGQFVHAPTFGQVVSIVNMYNYYREPALVKRIYW